MADVHLAGITKSWGTAAAVENITFSAPAGHLVALLGPSGCGKSTTLMAIAGFNQPDQGRIAVGDETFFDAARRINVAAERRNLGKVVLTP